MRRFALMSLSVLFIVSILVMPTSAEPRVVSLSEAVTVIPADLAPKVEFFEGHGAGFHIGVAIEVRNVHISEKVRFTVLRNGEPTVKNFFHPVGFATRGGSESVWLVRQAPMDSYFNDVIGTILVPGTYAVTALIPYNEEIAFSATKLFEVRQYETWANFCKEQNGTERATIFISSLWDALPGQVWVGRDNMEFRAELVQHGAGFGIVEHESGKGLGNEVSIRIPGPPEGHEQVFRVPRNLFECNDSPGKGSRTE